MSTPSDQEFIFLMQHALTKDFDSTLRNNFYAIFFQMSRKSNREWII